MKSRQRSTKKPNRSREQKASESECQTLAHESRHLRCLFQEVVDAYVVRVSAIIQRLTDHFEGTDIVTDEGGKTLSKRQYERILTSIRRLDVNPPKGRRRDLKSIEELAEEIEDIIHS